MEDYFDKIYLQLENIIRAKLGKATNRERPKCIVLSAIYNEYLFRRIHKCIAEVCNDGKKVFNAEVMLIGVGDFKRTSGLRQNLSDLTHSQFISADCTDFIDVMTQIKLSQGFEQQDILLICSSDISKCDAQEKDKVQDCSNNQNSDYFQVWGEKKTGHGIIVLHGCQNLAVDKKDRYCIEKASSITKSTYSTIGIDELICRAASYDMLMNTDFFSVYPILFPELQSSILVFEHRAYRIRLTQTEDISTLVELEV